MLDALAKTGIECRVYGARRSIEEEQVEGSLRYRPFSEDGFIADLASCRAVVAGGGFTLMGEAVYLRKPMLSVPLLGQFEQVLNARYLQAEKFGRAAEHVDDPVVVQKFIRKLPKYEAALERYEQDGNKALFDELDRLLDCAEASTN